MEPSTQMVLYAVSGMVCFLLAAACIITALLETAPKSIKRAFGAGIIILLISLYLVYRMQWIWLAMIH